MNLTDSLKNKYKRTKDESLSINEFLELAKDDPSTCYSPAERLLKAIGEPELIDTSEDPVLQRLFNNRVIKKYPSFKDFYGLEETIERFVAYVRHAAQGLEEGKQICYFLGPVGGGKSSLVEKIKYLMEKEPFYAIKDSPVFDNPLSLFHEAYSNDEEWEKLHSKLPKLARTKLRFPPSPWLVKRLIENEGNTDSLRVVKIYPSKLKQIAISRTEPGDPNNQDISTLIGKVDLRKIEEFSQNDADAYLYSGALCRGNRGCMEFVEMFKAPLPVLNPLLSATQEGVFNGTEALSGIPFDGLVFAHSNETEWALFKNNAANEALLDRVYLIRVPYCLRVDEEVKIHKKMIANSELSNAPVAPRTYETLSELCVLSRLKYDGLKVIGDFVSKMKVYNGESLKDKDNDALTINSYKALSGVDEGMSGIGTRFTYKVLSKTFNHDSTEIAANPIHLIDSIRELLKLEQLPKDKEDVYNTFIDQHLLPNYLLFLGEEIQQAFFDTYLEFAQNIHDQYYVHADMRQQEADFKDPNTGSILSQKLLEEELQKIEKPAQIVNPREFRNDFVTFVLRYKAKNGGKMPKWDAYSKMAEVIKKKMYLSAEEILPIISFNSKKTSDDSKKQKKFFERMKEKGYTEKQVRLLVESYERLRKSK